MILLDLSIFFLQFSSLLTAVIAQAKIVGGTTAAICPLLLPRETLTFNSNNIRAVEYSRVPSQVWIFKNIKNRVSKKYILITNRVLTQNASHSAGPDLDAV